jgi:hypothetical protein
MLRLSLLCRSLTCAVAWCRDCAPTPTPPELPHAVLRLRMLGSLGEYTADAIGRIRLDLATILHVAPCDFDIEARARTSRRKAAGVELVITFRTAIAAQTAAMLVEKIKTGTARTLAGFMIELAELLEASMLPTLRPAGLSSPTGVPSMLPSQAPSNVPSLAPSQTPSSVPILAPSSPTERTSMRPSLSPTRQPTQASTLSLRPTRLPRTKEPLVVELTTIPPTPEDQSSSTLEPTQPPSATESVTGEFFFGTSSVPASTEGTAAPSDDSLLAPATPQATESPVALLTRTPTRLPTASPSALPQTTAPVAPGPPPDRADPTSAPAPAPCPGRPPCLGHGECNKTAGECSCRPGWYREDCSEYLLSSLARGNTSELQTQAAIHFLLAEMPKHDVMCPVTVEPPNEARANTARLTFVPKEGFDQIEASVTLTGQPDWKNDGDTPFAVRVGPCISADARYEGIGFPQLPAVTSVRLVNEDVPFPTVAAVVPSAVLTSGRRITVHGNSFGPEPRVIFCSSVLGRPSGPGKWVWVHNNATGRDMPIKRTELALLQRAVLGGDHSDLVTINEPGMNLTLCDAMEQEGFQLSNCSGDESDDLEKKVDLELSALLQFRNVNESLLTFITPCLNTVSHSRACSAP